MQRLSTRAFCLAVLGLLFCATTASAQEQSIYEVKLGYGHMFASSGDVGENVFHVSAARNLFSDRTGLELRLTYQRAVSTNVLANFAPMTESWDKNHTYVADLAFYFDVANLRTGAVGHRLRIAAGPSLRLLRGEKPMVFSSPGAFISDPNQLEEYKALDAQYDSIQFYYARVAGDKVRFDGLHSVLTRDRRGTDWGGTLALIYGITYQKFVASLGLITHSYSRGNMQFAWGLSLGMRF